MESEPNRGISPIFLQALRRHIYYCEYIVPEICRLTNNMKINIMNIEKCGTGLMAAFSVRLFTDIDKYAAPVFLRIAAEFSNEDKSCHISFVEGITASGTSLYELPNAAIICEAEFIYIRSAIVILLRDVIGSAAIVFDTLRHEGGDSLNLIPHLPRDIQNTIAVFLNNTKILLCDKINKDILIINPIGNNKSSVNYSFFMNIIIAEKIRREIYFETTTRVAEDVQYKKQKCSMNINKKKIVPSKIKNINYNKNTAFGLISAFLLDAASRYLE